MKRTIHEFQQGDDQWHAHRRAHFNASEVPAMLGISPYQSRSDLLKVKASGAADEVSGAQQALFDAGHRAEADARPIAEKIVREDLYPIVASVEIDGLPLSASYDGATMAEDTVFEHKLANKDLIAAMDHGEVPEPYRAQIEQQLMIVGAIRCLFMVSNGDTETERHAWVKPDPVMRARILAGWKQFRLDLDNFRHVEDMVKPAGKSLMELPALTVQLVGEVKSSNLIVYRESALAFIRSINTKLETDEDFATAEKTVTFCGEAEKRLDLVKSQALAQTTSIDELFRTLDLLRDEMRSKRLELDKLVKNRKEAIREDIRRAGADAYGKHIEGLNARLGKNYMPIIPADWPGVMKGLRTISSLRDAVATELARVKIESNEEADKIDANLKWFAEYAKGYEFLFPDLKDLVLL